MIFCAVSASRPDHYNSHIFHAEMPFSAGAHLPVINIPIIYIIYEWEQIIRKKPAFFCLESVVGN